MAAHRGERAHAAVGGIAAGVIAGIANVLLSLRTSSAAGRDVWMALKGAAVPFLGQRALRPGPDAPAVVAGLASHFAVSITWGLLFGLLFFGFRRVWTVPLGMAWGIVVWLGMYRVVLPSLGLGGLVAGVPVSAAVFGHVLFGLFVGLGFLPFQRTRLRSPSDVPVQRPTRGGRDLEPPDAPPPP